MLRTLTVQDLVVVRTADVEFGPGLTVLTGETGAGKSILVGALGLALGDRAETRMVRSGAKRASVTAVFDAAQAPAVRALLAEHDLDSDDECVLRRVVSRDGRSRAFCNASPVPVALLREIGAALVDVHAQHAGQQLLRREVQRDLLDAYGDTGRARDAVAAAYAAWKRARDELEALERAVEDGDRLELLSYQVEELEAARLDDDEVQTIEAEHRRLAHAAEHEELCAGLRQALDDDAAGAAETLRAATALARPLADSLPDAASLLGILEQAGVLMDEARGELERLESTIEVDPGRLAGVDTRLAELHGLARKHRVDLAALPEVRDRLSAELEAWRERTDTLDALRGRITALESDYADAAGTLGAARREAAAAMNEEIGGRLRELGIPDGVFEARVEARADAAPQPHGSDRVEFLVATNAGQAPAPLAKVASGGELSRIGLAIQAATARHSGVPVVVYDEVDTGIGGTTATTVGRNLRAVAAHTQVICITHSPQVASAGDRHLRVVKSDGDAGAETRIETLDDDAREAEISRMLGAAEATASSVAHARDLIATAGGRG